MYTSVIGIFPKLTWCAKHCVCGCSTCIHSAYTLFHKEQHDSCVRFVGHLNIALPWPTDMTIEVRNNRMIRLLRSIDWLCNRLLEICLTSVFVCMTEITSFLVFYVPRVFFFATRLAQRSIRAKYVGCLKSLLENCTTRRNECKYPSRSVGGETSWICSLLVSLGLVLSALTWFLEKWHVMVNVFLWNKFQFDMSRFVTVVINFTFMFCLSNNMCLGRQMLFTWRDEVPPSFFLCLPLVTL
jgi:hypothetical protein